MSEQNRREFLELLDKALAVDPDAAPQSRLHNLLTQRKARYLKERVDDLFFDDGTEDEEGGS